MPRFSPLALCVTAAIWMAAAAPCSAQGSSESQKRDVILKLLQVTHAAEQVTTAIETGIPMQRAANPRIPAVFWERFQSEARSRRGEFVDSLVPLYSRTFDLADLKAMLKLYQSPFGQRLLRIQPTLMQESMQLGQRWGARIGAKIGQDLAAEGVKIEP